jgi:enediyne biosynthesis protein E4
MLLTPIQFLEAAEWTQVSGYRSAPLEVNRGEAGFTRLDLAASGITFTNYISEQRHLTNQVFLNGAGVAAGDIDGDGLPDLYFCGLEGPNALYRNLGNWRFEDITEQAGVACPDIISTGAALADLNGDGALDLIVNSVGGGTHIFMNDGKGRFTRIAQLNENRGGMSLALGDFDGDGFLDLYVANYRTTALMDMPNARALFKIVDGKRVIDKIDGRSMSEPDLINRFHLDERGRIVEQGEPDILFRNLGGTNFAPVPFTGGAFLDEDGQPLPSIPFDWGLSVAFRDLNGDSLPDIYVCNDFESPDRVWINLGDGRFQAAPRLALRKIPMSSMAVDFADINRDGFDDFFVLEMLSRDHRRRMRQMMPDLPALSIGEIEDRPKYGLNMLFLNRGDGTYAEIGQLAGLEAAEWAWLTVFLDVDLDGYEDILICNGQERAALDLDVVERLNRMRAARRMSDSEIFQARRMFPRLNTANLAFRNRGDLTFEEVSAEWGFDTETVSQGLALADLDNDGDLDVVVNNFNAAPSLFRNNTGAPRLAVRLRGQAPNTHGIGAKIKVLGGAVPLQSQEMMAGGRFLSCDQAMRVFAAGEHGKPMRIEVTWRSGKQSVVERAEPNRIYEISESPGDAMVLPVHDQPADKKAFFEDVSHLLGHSHHETPFNDFARQPLLPIRLSQHGPGVSWHDVNGDGWDDLIIGSGKGGELAVYLNDKRGGFQRMEGRPVNMPVTRDQTTVLGWQKAPGQFSILAGSSNHEDGLAIGSVVRQFDLSRKLVEDTFPASPSSTGPMAMADVDGDGDLDLFVGGRSVPGKYPAVASSILFRNKGGKFDIDVENTRLLANIGMVSGAIFSDLNGDGYPDLILACDWGPVRVFRNSGGKFSEATEALGLAEYKGWWNGVATGDFNGDGKLDIVASNWGRNSKYERHRSHPLRIYFGDMDGDGTWDIIESYFDEPLQKWVPLRQFGAVAQALPLLRERFSTHQAYAEASVEELLGKRFGKASFMEANWLESTVFLNRGNRFEATVLPVEAQFAPAFGVAVADFDGDGHEDIFLAQNFFATEPGTPRYDAGRGLWLRGDGQGGFSAVRGIDSGVAVYGEQRGMARCDYDQDGRVDLVVTQNGAATKLYRNVGARPGLRVRLRGPRDNPNGVGATLWLMFGNRAGPVREIRAGGGYWSQDSVTEVLSIPEQPTELHVRWPGGEITRSRIPASLSTIELDMDGNVL